MVEPGSGVGKRRTTAVLDGLRVAVAQVTPRVGDVNANLALANRYLRRAAARSADLVVLPECFLHGYTLRPDVLGRAEAADGHAVTALRELAARHAIAVVGGFIERNPGDAQRPFNSAAVIDSAGGLVGVYRKTHLFGGEHQVFSAGAAYPVFRLCFATNQVVTIGVAICADIEYPEVIRLLALRGAQLITVPSADMEPYRVQQAANMMSRAVENNVYVALANTIDERDGFSFFGGSGIAGPAGSLRSAGYGRPRLVVGELSEAEVVASGGRSSYLRGRRPETYGGLLEPSLHD